VERVVRSVCQACQCECGVMIHVKDGRVTKIEGDPKHPMNKGYTCFKGKAEPERVYHPDRLRHPMRRVGEKGEGRWQRISWDAAIDGIAEKLTEIKEKYGPETIAVIHGTGPRAANYSAILPSALGSPNRISVDLHICFAPSIIAENSTVGHSITMDTGPDYQAANCILVWGANPLASHPPQGNEIVKAKRKRKAKLIVIDPRQTHLASLADLWLPIRPGTDVALALSMINVIINQELYDKEFVDKWCHGFAELKERVKDYAPESIGEITWIPADKIREAARLYATTKPATLHHRVAIEHNVNSTQSDRAMIILVALTGNIDVEGGNLLRPHVPGYISSFSFFRGGSWLQPSLQIEQKRIGGKEFPLLAGPEAFLPCVPSPLAAEAMDMGKPYPIKALYCAGANPVVNMQNSKRVWHALQKPELLVVADFFMTPTAELADYALPTTTWLERDDCCDGLYLNYISARQKAIEPLGECWDDLKIVIELVKRIPWANREVVPWNDTNECFEWMIKGTGLTFDEFKKKGYVTVPTKFKKYEERGFETPSGRVELYSTIFEKFGCDPLPSFREPPESPVSTPELIEDYPLILITGSRNIEYFHSEGRQIQQLRKRVPDPEVEIHPDTAKKMNVKEGEWVWIETPKVKNERVKFKTKLTASIHPRVIHATHGWWLPEKSAPEHGCFDSNINVVTSADPPREEICCSVPTRGLLCRVYK